MTSRLKLAAADAEHKRQQEANDAAHKRHIEKIMLIALLVVSGCVLVASRVVLAVSDKTQLQMWATGALSTLLAGYFGWFTGRQGK